MIVSNEIQFVVSTPTELSSRMKQEEEAKKMSPTGLRARVLKQIGSDIVL